MTNWHTKGAEDVMRELRTTERGLSDTEVYERQKKYGPNKLEKKSGKGPISIFLEQFKSVLVIILIIAAGIAFLLGELADAIAISVIVMLNAVLGFHQEFKAERSIEALKKLIVPKVVVYRNGKAKEINAEELVPGDVIALEEGNRVPADIRLIENVNLRTDESALTGESVPVGKEVGKVEKGASVGDRKNMAFMGTLVTYGRCKGIVAETGMSTEIGKIASLVQEKQESTPLQMKLNKFGITIGKLTLGVASIVFAIGILTGLEPFLIFLTSVSLAVAVIPEGLPAVVALTLSLGTQRMLKKNAVVRRLASVEALGSATIICSDKTGTMTTNEMTVRKIWVDGKTIDVSGVGFRPTGDFKIGKKVINPHKNPKLLNLLRTSKACNNSILKNDNGWYVIGDPTEGALKVLALKASVRDIYTRVNEIPFSSFRKKMTTINVVGGKHVAFMKGAPEVVLRDCRISKTEREKVLKVVHDFATRGMRVLAFAEKKLGSDINPKMVEKNMSFLGLVAMIDPPRKETKNSIELCRQAGIKTIMLTGDHKLTARAIGHEVGLDGDVVTGEDIDDMNERELDEKLKNTSIFARISPEHKLKIVKKLQKDGHIVAVSGDGVNDAPALKAAEIGVAMGIKGSDVSKEASEMVLLDDNFSSIVSAVEEGRGVYDNVKKFVRYLIAANMGEVLFITVPFVLIFTAGIMPDMLPGGLKWIDLVPALLPVQLLWINLVTDGLPALALGVDPKEKDVMKRKPRKKREGILQYSWPFLLAGGVATFIATFSVFMMSLDLGIEKARTMAFSTFVIFEVFFVFNCRSETRSVFRFNPFNNKWLVIAVMSSILLQVAVVQTPMLNPFFDTVPLAPEEWLTVFIFGSIGLFILPEIFIKRFIKDAEYTN